MKTETILMDRRNKGQPLVSIIVPVFNTELYIIDTLNSICASFQDDLELIIVDDGSTDNSNLRILEWVRISSLNVIFISKSNNGLGAARNTGLQYATGKYVAFFDSDDYAISSTYQLMLQLAEKNNLDMIVARAKCFSNVTLKPTEFGDHNFIEKILSGQDFIVTNSIREGRLFRIEPSAVIRLFSRQFFMNTIQIFPENRHYEDVVPHAMAMAMAQRIGILNEFVLLYRIDRPGQITSQKGATRLDILKSVDEIAKSNYINHLSDSAGACLCGLIARITHWTGSECPKLYKEQFVDSFLLNITDIPSHWWNYYRHNYAENNHEARFCKLAARKDKDALFKLLGGQQFLNTSTLPWLSALTLKTKRIVKFTLLPSLKSKIRKFKNALRGAK